VPLGRFYKIGAVTTTAAAQHEPFGLALPVPDGADTAHLAIALFGPPSRRFGDPGGEDEWLPILGYYDSENRLFSIDLPCLFAEGRTVVVVEDPNFMPLSLPTTQTSNAVPQLRSSKKQETDFCVTCTFTDDTREEDETALEKLLQDAYDKYTSLGYCDPALVRGTRNVTILGIITIATAGPYSDIFLLDGSVETCNGGRPAEYDPDSQFMFFCFKRDDAKLSIRTRHEMFHAFQQHFTALHSDFLYINPLDPKNASLSEKAAIEEYKWIVEGTAAAAEESGETMSRSSILNRDLHPINVALTASELFDGSNPPSHIEYHTQDFWVYFGLKNKLGLAYLKPLFELGATAAAVDKFFTDEHGTSLGAEYWEWVKNQAIEKTIDFGGVLKNPGHIELDLIGTPQRLQYPPRDQLPAVEGTLPRLTSQVVQIDFSAGESAETYTVTVAAAAVSGAADGLKYKVCKEGDTDFAAVDDGPRIFNQEPTPFVACVILSNLHYKPENSLSYRVTVFQS
jgi:hypothetical protein